MSLDFMQRAIALALENVRSGNGGPFAALIVKENRVIAEGTNRVTSTNDPTAHAEIVAIREACRALADFQLTGCDDAFIYDELKIPPAARSIAMTQLLRDDSLRIFSAWSQQENKKPY